MRRGVSPHLRPPAVGGAGASGEEGGGGGPLCRRAHPRPAGRGFSRHGGGRRAAALPPGGHRAPDALAGEPRGGVRGGAGGAGRALFLSGAGGLLLLHGGLHRFEPAARDRQSPAGCAADRRAALAPVRLHARPAGAGAGRERGRGLLHRGDGGRRRGLPRVSGDAGAPAPAGAGHECGSAALARLQRAERAGHIRRDGPGPGAQGEPDRPDGAGGEAGGRRLPGPVPVPQPAPAADRQRTASRRRRQTGDRRRAAYERPPLQGAGISHRAAV